MADPLKQRLLAGIEALELQVNETQIDQLLEYLALIIRWNKAFNLTAIRDPDAMVVKHLLDSLAVYHCIAEPGVTESPKRVIDVGTGAGLPGIPLAIVFPGKQLALLDSNGKKTRFLFQVKTQLGLSNIEIIDSRVESFHPTQPFDAVISRAFASLDRMVDSCAHLLAPDGVMFAMKAASVAEEIEEMGDRANLLACHDLVVPFLGEARSLVTLKQKISAVAD